MHLHPARAGRRPDGLRVSARALEPSAGEPGAIGAKAGPRSHAHAPQSVEKVLISVMSMLCEPNPESGANLDACKMWREDRPRFEEIVRAQVRASLGL